jgi:hypothetical protein
MFSDKIIVKIKTHVLCSIPFLRKLCRLWVTYIHTFSMQQSPSWEVNRFSIIQEITTFYGIRRFVTAFKIVRHLSLSWAIYEKTWKNMVETEKPQIIIWRMRMVWCVPEATNTHSEYVTLIVFPRQQWLCEHASVLRLQVRCLCCLLYYYRMYFSKSWNTVALSRRSASAATCLVTAAVLGSVTNGILCGCVLFVRFIALL